MLGVMREIARHAHLKPAQAKLLRTGHPSNHASEVVLTIRGQVCVQPRANPV